MNPKSVTAVASFLALSLVAVASAQPPQRAMRVEDALWGNGELFDTILTPTSFIQPPSHSVDLLFNFSMSGLTGQRSVSEAVPGDPGFNGGRWWVQRVVFTDAGKAVFDPDGDGAVNFELTSAAEVLEHEQLGHLEIYGTSTYFECPMLHSKE